jgi:hypothetical protein
MAKKATKTNAGKSDAVKKAKAWDVYTDAEKVAYKVYMNELSQMRDNLRVALVEFDDKTYLQAYEENRKADLAYNQEVDETTDFRVTTGLTREKDTTVLSTLINFNLQPNISAFDKDNSIISELGNEMEDLVKKSRELEAYPEKRQDIYRELIAQGAVYVEEVYKEVKILSKYDTDWQPTQKIADFKGDDKPIYDVEGKCETKLHLGKYVLFSSMNEPELQNNGTVATYEEVDRSVAHAMYGTWDRWELVPEEVNNETPFKDNATGATGSDYMWNTYKVAKGKVGITKVMKRFENKAMIFLNGVMVLPVNFPLTKLSPSGLYPIAKGLGERIPNFAVGKGIPSKTRVDQKMYDTFLRAMVGKAWQSYKPALGNKSGNVLSRDIVNANQITHGIKQNDIFTILPQQLLSITNGDVSMFELVKQVINEKSTTDSYAGQTVSGTATATEIVNQQKQTMLKLASLIDGVRSLEKRLILLRIYNIVTNWTKSEEAPVYDETVEVVDGVHMVTGKKINPLKKEKKFKQFATDTSFTDGKKGTKISKFIGNEEKLPSVREQIQIEDKMAEDYGKPVRMSYINAEWLRQLEVIWNVDVIVSSDTDDQMQLLMFMDNLARIAKLFGVQVFKQDYVLQRIAGKMNEDPDKLFASTDQSAIADMLKQLSEAKNGKPATQVDNPAQQMANANRPTPMSAAQVS